MNFNTDKLIRVVYPSNAGGKFLINSLGLSKNCVFQHNIFAKTQLAFPDKDFVKIKFNYILRKIKESKNKTWNDLGLGCAQLFGIKNNEINRNSFFNKDIIAVSNSGKYFFIVCHLNRVNNDISFVWPNSREIVFYNFNSIRNLRVNNKSKHKLVAISKNPLYWNTENYFSKSKTLTEIEKLYQQLDLSDFREDLIGTYYDLWTEVIGISEYCDYS